LSCGLFGKIELALPEIDSITPKADPLQLKKGALIEPRLSGEQNPAAGTKHSVPGEFVGI